MFYRALPVAILSLLAHGVTALYPTKLVYESPVVGSWFENLVVRPNGSIVFTSIGTPGGIHMINPLEPNPTPVLLHQFPHLNSTAGIAEASPDVFYVVAANLDLEYLDAAPHSNNIFRLSFDSSGQPEVKHVAHVKEALLLNGLVAVSPSLLLGADSDSGLIYAIDTSTGDSYVAVNDTLFAPPPYYPFTVNGLKFRGNERNVLYVTSTGNQAFCSVPIHANGTAAGPAVQLASSAKADGYYDDFTFDSAGNAYATLGTGNTIQKITFGAGGSVKRTMVVAGNLNSTEIAEPSAVAFGRTDADEDILYVTTGGGSGQAIEVHNKPVVVGAQIVAVNTCRTS